MAKPLSIGNSTPNKTEDNKPFRAAGTLMVQGTTSDAGKSILVTALCRILARHRISVAPFKSQNMALNSAVTADGGEIGRAQAVQAEACYLDPQVVMNPVLLKPNSELGSQVIVNGKALGNMQAREYHAFKPELLNTVVAAHQQLQQQYLAVVVEGAGSPAEINLREHDIANMGFAEAVDCPVIIVADIDRGGVFAHLYGTYALLSESEQQRVVGFVINRFRGDVKLLEPGLTWLEEKTSVPTIAVIPYLHNLHIEAEDSLSRSQRQQALAGEEQPLRVVIIKYPRASNHTDFDVLRLHPQLDCQFVESPAEFDGADLIILPGSKNVRGDLSWLKQQGWPEVIDQHLRYGGKLLGICGGFQMLGQQIHDPLGIEATPGSSDALAYLDMETRLTDNKTLQRVAGVSVQSGAEVCGYEIHAGQSSGPALDHPMFQLQLIDNDVSICIQNKESPFMDGAINSDGRVKGTYVHGLFDQSAMLREILAWAGLKQTTDFDYHAFRDQQINRLADAIEQEIPVDKLLTLMNINKEINTVSAKPAGIEPTEPKPTEPKPTEFKPC